ncbi:hypothetical protein HYX10_05750 [Candidatus Woesearchaeota archaeon]|nr:hypothetical protein [Candidatus Woesearchaeota archaeon]
MKHPASVVVTLLALFFSAQIVGLLVLGSYIDRAATADTGITTYKELPAGIERPDIAPNYAFIFIGMVVLIGTLVMLAIIKFRKMRLWKLWYFFAVLLSLAVAFAAFIPQLYAWTASLAASLWKVLKPNPVIHNLTELFIYSGLAAIFVPIMSVFSASVLLVLISIYDMYAVWKSKHMVSLAKFQTASRMFAGISIPKNVVKSPAGKKMVKGESSAIVGGGDIAFPLLFAGTLLPNFSLQQILIIPVFATAALAMLFLISKKGKFYPAMPFVSAGCFLGYAVLGTIA